MSGLPAVQAAKDRQAELERTHRCLQCDGEVVTYLGDNVEVFHWCPATDPRRLLTYLRLPREVLP